MPSDGSLRSYIYSEKTVGKLLRELNFICLKSITNKEDEQALRAAHFSSEIEKALDFVENYRGESK